MRFYCIDDRKHPLLWCRTEEDVRKALDASQPDAVPWVKPDTTVFMFELRTDHEAICGMLNGEPLESMDGGPLDLRRTALRYWYIGPRGGLQEVTRQRYLEDYA